MFHEFGHLLHHVLSRVPVRGLNDVAWDFVELPSQIMENWTWERECLDLFARHYQTGARHPGRPVPEADPRPHLPRRQRPDAPALIGNGRPEPARGLRRSGATGTCWPMRARLFQRFTPAPVPDDYAMVASFSHIFSGGYACGYYSYKWAEVLDADAFTRFQKEGIFSPKAGMAFRREILEKGNTEEPAVLFRNFMGRDPDPEALMRRNGLVKK